MIKKVTTVPAPHRGAFKKKEGPTDVDVRVGARLRERRIILGLTQDALASATGLTFQQIQKYEQGKNRISASRLLQFCNILKVEPNYFFPLSNAANKSLVLSSGALEDQDAFQAQDLMASRETLELVRTYYAIRDIKIRKNILKIIKQMVDNND